jgi:plasmid maintenance system antidote protein VapI
MSILDDLRKATAADGRSITAIAEQANIHRVSLSRFVSGDRDLSIEAAEKLADALGIVFIAKPAAKPTAKKRRP